jgi:hypothetical protein
MSLVVAIGELELIVALKQMLKTDSPELVNTFSG